MQEAIRRYIRLLVNQGINVQPGQHVLLVAEPSCAHLLEWAAEACYERGARFVDTNLAVPRVERAQLRGDHQFVPTYKAVQMDQLVDCGGAMLTLWSQDEPDLYEGQDSKRVNELRLARRGPIKRFLEEGLLRGGASWCGGGAPSPNWARLVYPEAENPVEAMWKDLLAMTFADREDCEERWAAHLEVLEARTATLDAMGIRELRFVNPARGTDLTVTLSPAARWVGGRTPTKRGARICANLPTFEVFTTPDWRGTRGTVGLTRPSLVNGAMVEGLWLRFDDGKIVEVKGERNVESYEALIGTEESARRLGEVALVGTDSPIFQGGRVYRHTLFDENAACHIATGMAYTNGLADGASLTGTQLDELGANRDARTHHDVMISDDTTNVYADGKELLVNGRWVL